jgi:chromosome segregation ATPase
MKAKNNEYTDTINHLNVKITELQRELDRALQSKEQLNDACRQLEKQQASVMGERQDLLSQLERAKSSYQVDIGSKDYNIQSLQKELSIVTARLSQEKLDKSRELDEAYDALKKYRAESANLNKEHKQAQEEVIRFNDIVTKLKSELKTKIKETADYKENLKDMVSENNRLKSQYKEQAESFEETLSKRLAEINELDYQLRNQNVELDTLKNEYKQTTQQLTLTEKRLEESNDKYNELKSYNKKLLKENRDLNTLLNNNSLNLETTINKYNTINTELNNLQQRLESTTIEHRELERVYREYKVKIQELIVDLNNTFDTNIKEIISLIENSIEDLFKFNIPRINEAELNKNPEVITNTFISFFELLKDKVKILVQENYAGKTRLEAARKEIVDRLAEKNNEIQRLKSENNESVSIIQILKDKLYTIEKQLTEAYTE